MKQRKLLKAHDKKAENNHEAEMLVQAFKASSEEKAQQQLVENNSVPGMSFTELQEAAALADIFKKGVE